MAVAFASVQSNSADQGAGTSFTITKPTGLAAGDLMIAIFYFDGNGRTATLTGWTQKFAQNGNVAPSTLVCMYKVASAGDAAASDFTFTTQDVSRVGYIARITGTSFAGADNIGYDVDVSDSSDTPTYSGGVTTTANNALLMLGAGVFDNQTVSTQAVANSNPSWTEQVDLVANLTQDIGISLATATFATAGATGDYSLAIAGGLNSASTGYLLYVVESSSVTVSPSVIDLTLGVQAPTVSGGANVSPAVINMTLGVQDPTVTTAGATWTETSKGATPTWVETSKS